MKMFKKIWKFLSSMRFAVILLAVMAAACAAGSFISQGQSYEWYVAEYSQRAAAAIMLLHLDDVFRSWWFVGITLFLCLNLLLCNVVRFAPILKRFRAFSDASAVLASCGRISGLMPDTEAVGKVFSGMGFGNPEKGTDSSGREWMHAAKNAAGIWGAWVTHFGILILIAGFSLGQIQKKEYTVYGVPGQSKPVGDTSYVLTIDDFNIALREDDTVEQYTSDITVRDMSAPESEGRSSSVSVNHPASLFGMKFYQNSTGWAARITILKNKEEIQSEVICAGDYIEVEDKPGLAILFSAFYPDYYYDQQRGPSTASSRMDNPGYLYRAYYMNQVIGMNILTGDDVITIDEYTVVFSDPQSYTLIQIKRDPYTPAALLGGLVILCGLLLSFYVQPRRLWAVRQDDGRWMVTGSSRKGGALFDEQLRETITGNGGQREDEDSGREPPGNAE